MSFVLAFSMLGSTALPAYADQGGSLAAGQAEFEPQGTGDDSPTSARGIAVNTTYANALNTYNDEDWYRFTLTQPGAVSLTFDKDYQYNEYGSWYAYLYKSDLSGYFSRWSFRVNDAGPETTGKIGLPAGTYYVKVDSGSLTKYSYNFKVNFAPSAVWDREPTNDSPSGAQSIAPGTTQYGTTYNSSDEDWYRFTLTQPGAVSLTFDKDYQYNEYGSWYAYLYKSDLSGYFSRWSFRVNDAGPETTGKIGLPAGTYYVKVEGSFSTPIQDYNFKVNFAPSAVWDREPTNDSPTSAQSIALNTKHYGTIYTGNDEDWYRFTVKKSGPVWLAFGKKYETGSGAWSAQFYNSRVAKVTSFDSIRVNEAGTKLLSAYLSKGTYYLKVNSSWSAPNTPYNFTVMQGSLISSASVKVKSTTYNGKQRKPAVTVKYQGKTLKKGRDYTVSYANNVKAGKGKVTIKGKGAYCYSKTVGFTIAKAKQTLTAKAKSKAVKRATVKKKAVTVKGAVVAVKAKGRVVYKNVSTAKAAKKFKVNSKTGSITVPKNTKKGTYKVKVKVTAKGTANYKAGSKTVTAVVRVR